MTQMHSVERQGITSFIHYITYLYVYVCICDGSYVMCIISSYKLGRFDFMFRFI